jgi:hypothetical protein
MLFYKYGVHLPCFKRHKKGHRLFHCPELKGKEAVGALSKQKLWWQGCSSDESEQLATSTSRLEALVAKEVVETHSTPPSTIVATLATQVACRCR